MNTTTTPVFRHILTYSTLLGWLGLISLISLPCRAQEDSDQASVTSSIGDDGTGTIVVEAHGRLPEPPVFYTASANATAHIAADRIEQVIQLTIKVIQGNAKTLSFGLNGEGQVTEVQGENLRSWYKATISLRASRSSSSSLCPAPFLFVDSQPRHSRAVPTTATRHRISYHLASA